jgi:plasmid stability protein
MSNLTSARLREETPHSSDALKRRAQSIINDKSIEAETRAIIRYGLEINDPWLGDLVRCVDAGESIIDNLYVHSSEEKTEALTGLISRAGDEASAALLVLLSTLENSTHPKALANTAKHLAFTRCGELNLYGMVDAQIETLEGDLLARNAPFP